MDTQSSTLSPTPKAAAGGALEPPPPSAPTGGEGTGRGRIIGLVVGIAVFVILLALPAPEGMSGAAWRTTAVAALMALWWVTEAIPIAATALLPLALFPLLGVMGIGDTAAPYANPTIFLFFGGFVLALAMERCGLHRRLAFSVVRAVGVRPRRVVLGVMLATGFLSMWVSNTATAVMMLPIGLSVIRLIEPGDPEASRGTAGGNFAACMMLGIAYAATIGGLGTLIGTPPNALLAGFMSETYGVQIGFVQWMMVGVPLVALMLPVTWLYLTRVALPFDLKEIPGGGEAIDREHRKLGALSRAERWVIAIATGAAILWIARPALQGLIPGLDDGGIAVIVALVLFAIPLDRRGEEFLMTWKFAEKKLPWGVLILFGGGLSLAAAVQASGLAEWIGRSVAGVEVSLFVMLLLVTTVVIFFTELTSNTATAAAFLPLVTSVAAGLGENPLLLAIPAALAASTGFMMPVGTPPNAIAYASGYVSMRQMMRTGWMLNLICVAVIILTIYGLAIPVFGIEPGVLPDWVAR